MTPPCLMHSTALSISLCCGFSVFIYSIMSNDVIGPVYPVRFEYILGYYVLDSRPEFIKWFTVRISEWRDVVQKGVEPNIGDVIAVKGQLNTPFQARLGPGDAQVAQRLPQKTQHLIAPVFGLNKFWMIIYISIKMRASQPLILFIMMTNLHQDFLSIGIPQMTIWNRSINLVWKLLGKLYWLLYLKNDLIIIHSPD